MVAAGSWRSLIEDPAPRPEGRNEQLAEALRAQGHDVVCEPLIAVEPTDEPVSSAAHDWLIVTSVTGAEERGGARPGEARGGNRPCDCGSSRRRRPRSPGVDAEGLLDELPRPAGLVLFAGAEGARRLLVEELDAEFVPLALRTRALQPSGCRRPTWSCSCRPPPPGPSPRSAETVAVSIGRDHEAAEKQGSASSEKPRRMTSTVCSRR